MEHVLSKTILISKVIELISKEERVSLSEARDRLYQSEVISLIDDDETGLFGQSPLYVYGIYHDLNRRQNKGSSSADPH